MTDIHGLCNAPSVYCRRRIRNVLVTVTAHSAQFTKTRASRGVRVTSGLAYIWLASRHSTAALYD